MRKLIIILLIFAAILSAKTSKAMGNAARELLYEKYSQQLETAVSAHDSVRILYTLFDLSPRKGQLKHGWEILNTATRAEDFTAQIDMLRTLATFYSSNDSVINLLLEQTNTIPNETSRVSTKTYILNQYFARKNRQATDPEIQRMLLDSITKSHNLKGHDIYDEISLIYQIIQFLGVDAEGVLFRESIEAYEDLMNQLPMSDYPLKSQFNTTAAIINSRLNGDVKKAIQYDRNLLDIMDQLQQMYQKQNRNYRNYDVNKFISYRRMLSNYPGLSSDELEEIHDSLLLLRLRDADIKRTIDIDGDPSGFYYMAIKDYEKAIPLLKDMMDGPYLTPYQRQKYYAMIMEAAKAIGDHDNYVDAMENFIESLLEIDSIKGRSIEREILVRDSILPTPLLESVVNHKKSKAGSYNQNEKTYMILSAVLALLLIIYMTLYVRLRLKRSTR